MGNSQSYKNASPSISPPSPQHTQTPTTTTFVSPQHSQREATPTPAQQHSNQTATSQSQIKPKTQQSALPASQKVTHNVDNYVTQSALPASQKVRHNANNYVILAAECEERTDPWDITPRQNRKLIRQRLRVCPQYNGQGCVAEPCRRLHVCLYWATKTCNKNSCERAHFWDAVHNIRLLEAHTGKYSYRPHDISVMLDDTLGTPAIQEEQQICLFNVLRRCSKKPCPRVHSTKNYLWEVRDHSEWIQMSYSQSDYLELMYSHPSEECVDLIPLQTHIGNNRNLQRLASIMSKETSWSVDLESFKLKGTSSEHDIRRLSTSSDLTSRVPVATRWLWYWQDDDGCWEPYREGADEKYYYVALSDHLEYILRVYNMRFVTINIGNYSYTIDGKKMTQTNKTIGTTRRIRRRPACSLVQRKCLKFDELFLTLPKSKKFLKLPVLRMSSEFLFVENLMMQTLSELKILSMYRVQNDHLWKVYQNKKRLMVSLYKGDAAAINEQYLFHGTSRDVVDHICEDNLDWKLWGTNVGHLYGQGTYFTNLALRAHQYGKTDRAGKKVMLVVLVMVGKMTRGYRDTNFPPMNVSAGRAYDTTCDDDTNASIFVKYNRDEYYPAYVVRYACNS